MLNNYLKEDIEDLTAPEMSALKKIAKLAPTDFVIISDEISIHIIQSLLSRRLIVHIAHKIDIYWDIFKDYLNTGQIPIQENYILRVFVNQIDKALKELLILKKSTTKDKIQKSLSLGDNSFYNLMRDMKLLGLARYENNKIDIDLKNLTQDNYNAFIKSYLNEKLKKNRIIKLIIEKLGQSDSLSINELSSELSIACPYITATSKTWITYSKIFSDWLDFADLAIYNRSNNTLFKYQPTSELRERRGIRGRVRRKLQFPTTQFEPVSSILLRIIEAIQKQSTINIEGIRFSTYQKAIATLEDFGIVKRLPGKIRLLYADYNNLIDESIRKELLSEKFKTLDSTKKFLFILNEYSEFGASLKTISFRFNNEIGANWTEGTSIVHSKIMLDWSRKCGIVPKVFLNMRGKRFEIKETSILLLLRVGLVEDMTLHFIC